MPRAPSMTDLRTRLDSIRREIEKLQAQEALLLDMLDETPKPLKRAPKGAVKTTVLDLLEKVGRSGLNAAKAVKLVEAEGGEIDRGSVSSLLSRLKNDGIVVYDGDTYRLKKFSSIQGAVTPLRSSGDTSF